MDESSNPKRIVRFELRLSVEEKERLQLAAQERNMTAADILRDAIPERTDTISSDNA